MFAEVFERFVSMSVHIHVHVNVEYTYIIMYASCTSHACFRREDALAFDTHMVPMPLLILQSSYNIQVYIVSHI